MAAMVATGELAVLRIIGDLVKRRGCCDRTLAELAARPGLCRTLVQSAIREAGAPGPHAKNDAAKARRGPQPGESWLSRPKRQDRCAGWPRQMRRPRFQSTPPLVHELMALVDRGNALQSSRLMGQELVHDNAVESHAR